MDDIEKTTLHKVVDAARDFADYHSDYETADLLAIAGGAQDICLTDKTARIILAVRAFSHGATR